MRTAAQELRHTPRCEAAIRERAAPRAIALDILVLPCFICEGRRGSLCSIFTLLCAGGKLLRWTAPCKTAPASTSHVGIASTALGETALGETALGETAPRRDCSSRYWRATTLCPQVIIPGQTIYQRSHLSSRPGLSLPYSSGGTCKLQGGSGAIDESRRRRVAAGSMPKACCRTKRLSQNGNGECGLLGKHARSSLLSQEQEITEPYKGSSHDELRIGALGRFLGLNHAHTHFRCLGFEYAPHLSESCSSIRNRTFWT